MVEHHTHHPEHPSPTDTEPEEPPAKVWPFFVAIGIIMLCIIGYAVYQRYTVTNEIEQNRYNGYDFTPIAGGLWETQIQIGNQPYYIPFYYHPRDTLTVLIDPTATQPIFNAPKDVYISVDPNAGPKVVIAGTEISRITGERYNIYNIPTHGALSRPDVKNLDLPTIDCRNATPDKVVIQFVQGSKDVIIRSDANPSCVILQYTDANESIRVADRYTYMLLKIMH